MAYAGPASVAIQQFLDMVRSQYHLRPNVLAGTFAEYRNLVGDSFNLPIVDEGILTTRGAYHSDISQQVPDFSQKSITFENYTRSFPVDIFEQTEVNFNLRQKYAELAMDALNRRIVQVGIDALNASTTTNLVTPGTNLTVDVIRDTAKLMDAENVPPNNRYWLGHPYQKASLLDQTETTSSDYNTIRTLVSGQIDTFYGFKFIWVGSMTEGGLPYTSPNRTNFAWQKDSIAYGYKMNPTVVVEWDGRSQDWLIIPKVIVGANEVLPKGIAKITMVES